MYWQFHEMGKKKNIHYENTHYIGMHNRGKISLTIGEYLKSHTIMPTRHRASLGSILRYKKNVP